MRALYIYQIIVISPMATLHGAEEWHL
uniref:Uncharacterized protein n=1 Tax=Lepeophtheirus salmonis TaxID=72036 RepID=A0A0K2U769_LEPSM